MSGIRLWLFRFFALVLALWTGAGLHESIGGHLGWWTHPVDWVAHPARVGEISAWPITTLILILGTLAAAWSLRGYRGPGRKEGLVAVAGSALVLVATLAFFVPQLGVMADPTLAPDALVAASHRWIVLNAIRLLVLLVLGWYALMALGHFTAAGEFRDAPID